LTTTEVRALHERYRHAIEQCRDTRLPAETQKRAETDAVALRQAIDDAQLELVESRDADEARARFASVTHGVGGGKSNSEFRSLLEPIDPEGQLNRTITLPIETRAEYPLLTSDTGSQSYGGLAVGRSIYPNPVSAMVSESGILQAGPLLIHSTSGEELDVPYVLSTGLPDADYRDEGVDAAEATIVLSSALTVPKQIAGYCTVSEEWFSDAGIADAEGFVSSLIGKGLGVQLAQELSQGTGTTDLSGMFDTTVGIAGGLTTASSTSFSMAELLGLKASVSASNRVGAKWIFGDAAYGQLVLMVDGNGAYLLQPQVSAAYGDSLWGFPVVVDAYAPTVAATHHVAVFGRIQDAYVVRFVGGLTIESSDAPGYLKWTRTFRYRVRVAAMPLSAEAAKALVMKT
jgi:HK97 family phage major capsid protein